MDIRNYLEAYFEKPEVKQLIVQYISRKNLKYENLTNDQLMNILEDLNLIDSLL